MPDAVTDELIEQWRGGDSNALQQLLPLLYDELHRVARHQLRGERPDHTFQPTALLHEAYLRLAGVRPAEIQNRSHFIALASRLMRQVLVDHARAHLAVKRQGGVRIPLSEALDLPAEPEVDLLGVDEALTRLAQLDEQQAQVVELRFFGGLSIPETCSALKISASTVKRDWSTARAWLRRELKRAEES
jgi:RNA polymerase sigma factor (TIGR02999 family)